MKPAHTWVVLYYPNLLPECIRNFFLRKAGGRKPTKGHLFVDDDIRRREKLDEYIICATHHRKRTIYKKGAPKKAEGQAGPPTPLKQNSFSPSLSTSFSSKNNNLRSAGLAIKQAASCAAKNRNQNPSSRALLVLLCNRHLEDLPT